MPNIKRTPAGETLTNLIPGLFALNGYLLTAGDRLVEPLGLTSARWQVLGAVMSAVVPEPVSWLARRMGSSRQNIQRIANDLETQGLVAFESNPNHRRAPLVVLTDKGRTVFDTAMRLQAPWVNRLAKGLSVADVEKVRQVVELLSQRLEGGDDTD
ncbi:MarR family winged helix-turn-helix transcriptional regulator [Paraburkholderia sp. HP33-1]|uniref:MarR family winged helix-turn-helix transcriptional regulator n=1 Tax=Paraburkholderia sp. HP33-1 TaxID=2883243 RepID=UPI001F1A67A5|nr:MarR family winged helix-turn-helix transcriptional regulator [Paraburkholderia sp. HP33-1]